MSSLEKPQTSPLSRRHFLAGSAAALVASAPVFTLADVRSDPVAADPGGDGVRIRPFTFRAPQGELTELRRRIAATKWPSRELVTDASQGVQLATMCELARTWQMDYDWRRFEARLNALPQFMTTIDGVDIHFIHVRSRHPNALPVIVTHGWPGSIVEQMKIIDPLTNPTAHGGTASELSTW